MTTTALITGANRGIGFAVARQLGRSGVRVLVGACDAETGKRAAAELAAEGADADTVVLDGIVVTMACLPDDGPSGRFVDRNGTVPW